MYRSSFIILYYIITKNAQLHSCNLKNICNWARHCL